MRTCLMVGLKWIYSPFMPICCLYSHQQTSMKLMVVRCLKTCSSESSPCCPLLLYIREDKWIFNLSTNCGWLEVGAGKATLRRFLKSHLGLARKKAPVALWCLSWAQSWEWLCVFATICSICSHFLPCLHYSCDAESQICTSRWVCFPEL